MAISTMIGAKVQRREDPRLIRGRGRYVEDLRRLGTLSLVVVRSPHPHARIVSIDLEHAKTMPGVRAVLTAGDFKKVLTGGGGVLPVAPAFVAQKHTVP